MTAPAELDLGGASSEVVVDVLAPVAVDTAYSYRAPVSAKLEPGAFVRVPLGARQATGVVWATRQSGGDNLKPIAEVLDWPPLRPPLRDFIDWAARWTLAPRGMLLRMAIRAGEVAAPPAPKFGLVATGKAPARMTEARARVLAALAGGGAPTPKAMLAERARCSTSVIDGLVADGALAALRSRRRRARRRSTRNSARRCSTPTSAPRPTILSGASPTARSRRRCSKA